MFVITVNMFFLMLGVFSWELAFSYASITGHSNKLSKHAHKSYYENPGACFQKATCVPVQNVTCFGTPLPYSHTSIDLAEDSESRLEILDNLALWQGLQGVPRCWAVVQPLLCAVYMPKCENESVFLPSQEMCRITRGPCKMVELEQGWPSFLKCENKKSFPPHCRNPLQEIKFNITSKCIPPLIETDNPVKWVYNVEGCGIPCQNPMYTDKEHAYLRKWVCIYSSVCFAITLFNVITFFINWKSTDKYPQKIYFYLNFCWAMVSFGILLQFFGGTRENTICADDGTIQQEQPKSFNMCVLQCCLIYSFSMAACFWFVILTYAWYATVSEKSARLKLDKRTFYVHLCAWLIPFILVVAIVSTNAIDSDSMSGICFVGYSNADIRKGYVLAPVCFTFLVGSCFLALTLYKLIKIRLYSEEITNEGYKKKICRMMFQVCLSAVCVVVVFLITLCCHIYEFNYRNVWSESLKDHIVCHAMYSAQAYIMEDPSIPRCTLKHKPNVYVYHLHMLCIPIFGLMVSLYILNRYTLETWKSFFYRLCAPAETNVNTLKKHKIIARGFQNRHEINQGNFGFICENADALGLQMDLSSVASHDISTSWAMAFPRLLMRRNAVTHVPPGVNPRHYSSASDVSRYISMDSFNQPNLDSLSMQISERDFQEQVSRQRRKTRKERERFLKANRVAPWYPGSRRGSDTSLQSSLLAAAARMNKIQKSTSTSDLGGGPAIAETPLISLPQPRHRNLIQPAALNPPPFMHGMTDFSHRLDCLNAPAAVGNSIGQQRFTPVPIASGMPTPLPGMTRQPMFAQGYDVMSSIASGFIGNGLYNPMNGLYPRYPGASNFTFPPCIPYMTYAAYQSIDSISSQCQPSLIPLHPRADSASEPDYFPIVMSDSEYTDTGMRSYDESQVHNTQRLLQERLQVQLSAKAQKEAAGVVRPVLESQACAKTELLQRLKADESATQSSRPCSGRKSHNSAPPPSPAVSLDDLNDAEFINAENVNSETVNSETVNSETLNSENMANSEEDDDVFVNSK